jgi:hypothetical protein
MVGSVQLQYVFFTGSFLVPTLLAAGTDPPSVSFVKVPGALTVVVVVLIKLTVVLMAWAMD